MFQLNEWEFNNLKSQSVTSSSHGGIRKLPYAFTEQGVSMLSAVLRSPTAVTVSIKIMDAFVAMRKFLLQNGGIIQRIEGLPFLWENTASEARSCFHWFLSAKDCAGRRNRPACQVFCLSCRVWQARSLGPKPRSFSESPEVPSSF